MSEIDYRKFGLGAIATDKDIYEYPVAANSSSYPSEYILHTWNVKNQGSINSCVAHAVAAMREIQEYYETGREKIYSPGFIYGYRLDGHYSGEGMKINEACETLVKVGSVQYDDFPYNLEIDEIKSIVNSKKTTLAASAKNSKIKIKIIY